MTTTIKLLAIDLAKGSFQVCAVGADGTVRYNRVLSRTRMAEFLTCVVAMEACATSHHWGRVAQQHGHDVRLVPAAYAKSFSLPRFSGPDQIQCIVGLVAMVEGGAAGHDMAAGAGGL